MSKSKKLNLQEQQLKRKRLKQILKKASKYRFGNEFGDCFLMTMCLSKYMFEEENILLKTHIGGIKKSREDITTHLWSSYNGERIDLTSHTQPNSRVNGMILDEPIKIIQNAKLIYIKDMNTKLVKDCAKLFVNHLDAIDKRDTSVSHLLLKYIKTGIVPYEHLQKILDYKLQRSPELYIDFFNFMNEEVKEVA